MSEDIDLSASVLAPNTRDKRTISMAQHSIGETRSAPDFASYAVSLHTIVRIRLISALIIACSSLICFVGTSWDIQWHGFVGHDRTLIPPHEMMLSGIILSGIAALVLVVLIDIGISIA